MKDCRIHHLYTEISTLVEDLHRLERIEFEKYLKRKDEKIEKKHFLILDTITLLSSAENVIRFVAEMHDRFHASKENE